MMFTVFGIISVLFAYSHGYLIENTGCKLDVNKDLGYPETLILSTKKHSEGDWEYPTKDDLILLNREETVQLACPHREIMVNGSSIGTNETTAECKDDTTFCVKIFGNETICTDFSTIACTKHAYHEARYTGNKCEGGGREIEIGFNGTSKFLRTVLICFDETIQIPLWSKVNLTRAIKGKQNNVARPSSFFIGKFYHVRGRLKNYYRKIKARVTINKLLSLPSDSTKYIHLEDDHFLARGHLSARSDFVFAPQQRSTFWYVNVAPQWQTFNGANWLNLEEDIRDFAKDHKNDLVVYTGTYGIATLPNAETGESTQLFLYVDKDTKGIPVPELFWKVVYDPVQKSGVAFVGHNNPYAENVTRYCRNVCKNTFPLNWKEEDVGDGYSYCCEVDDLRRTVTHIPNMDTTSILT